MLRLLALACAVAGLTACGVGSTAPSEQLGALGEELVPAGAALLEADEGSCPQIAGNPSCARIFYTSDAPEEERADALEDAAEAAGWEVVSREPRVDGILVELGRDGYRAFAAVWEDERALTCHESPETSCADEIQVIEDI